MTTLTQLFGRIAERYNDWRERERAFAELSALDDRTLADLGLRRSDIPFVVYCQERSQTVRPSATVEAPAHDNGGLRAA